MFKVCQHAHPVFCAVAFIQLFHPGAGIFWAFITKSGSSLLSQLTIDDDAADTIIWFILSAQIASIAVVFYSLVCHAESAIHPAGGD